MLVQSGNNVDSIRIALTLVVDRNIDIDKKFGITVIIKITNKFNICVDSAFEFNRLALHIKQINNAAGFNRLVLGIR